MVKKINGEKMEDSAKKRSVTSRFQPALAMAGVQTRETKRQRPPAKRKIWICTPRADLKTANKYLTGHRYWPILISPINIDSRVELRQGRCLLGNQTGVIIAFCLKAHFWLFAAPRPIAVAMITGSLSYFTMLTGSNAGTLRRPLALLINRRPGHENNWKDLDDRNRGDSFLPRSCQRR